MQPATPARQELKLHKDLLFFQATIHLPFVFVFDMMSCFLTHCSFKYVDQVVPKTMTIKSVNSVDAVIWSFSNPIFGVQVPAEDQNIGLVFFGCSKLRWSEADGHLINSGLNLRQFEVNFTDVCSTHIYNVCNVWYSYDHQSVAVHVFQKVCSSRIPRSL